MKRLPCRLFPKCMYESGEDAFFENCVPLGFRQPISLYLSTETTVSPLSVNRAAAFFDQVSHWDTYCRKIFLSFKKGSEEAALVEEYCGFFRKEFEKDLGRLTTEELVKRFRFKGMASHERGTDQRFVVDFTLGFHQVLCVQFDCNQKYIGISWDS